MARIIQGVSSTFVWTVGLALLCDTTPETRVGQQLGLAMAGLSAGVVLAPPIGGALYQRLGFNAPFIFSIGIVLIDLAGRLLVIERKNAIPWGVDPARVTTSPAADSDQTHTAQGDDSDAMDTNSMTPPTPTEVSHRADPVVLAGLDGKLVVVKGTHAVLGNFPDAKKHTALSEQREDTNTNEAVVSAVHDLEGSSHSPTTDEIRSPIVFFDTSGQLTVVGRKVPASWDVHEESLKRSLNDSETTVHDTAQAQQVRVIPEDGIKKEGRGTLAKLNSDAVTSEGKLNESPQLSSMQVLAAMCRSRRALAAFGNTLIYG